MIPTGHCLLLLASVHDVMSLNRRLEGAGIATDMVPVPKELSSECGVALGLPEETLAAARELLDEKFTGSIRVFQREEGAFRLLAEWTTPAGREDGR